MVSVRTHWIRLDEGAFAAERIRQTLCGIASGGYGLASVSIGGRSVIRIYGTRLKHGEALQPIYSI